MNRFKQWGKKGAAVLLAAAMAVTMLPGTSGSMRTVQAEENTKPGTEYWTDDFSSFGLTDGKTIGKIRFGANDRTWAICGTETNGENSQLVLLSTSQFAQAAYGNKSNYSESNFYQDIAKYSDNDNSATSTYLSSTYFTKAEIDKMATVKVSTNEISNGSNTAKEASGLLYLPDAKDQNSYNKPSIYAGSGNNIEISLEKLGSGDGKLGMTFLFWLRSPGPYSEGFALVADPGFYVDYYLVNHDYVSVVPAFHLNLSSVLFASAAEAASSDGYTANSSMTANTYTLRYSGGSGSAVISADGTEVKISGVASTGTQKYYLMVQNGDGVYEKEITSADAGTTTTVKASEIVMGSALTNFTNCKVWLESTTDRITTAVMATQGTAAKEDNTNTNTNTNTDTNTDDSSDDSSDDTDIYADYVNQIANAADGATVTISQDSNVNALPNSIMQALYQKGTVNLTMTYTYDGQTYTVTIPAGGAVNEDTAWYGPLYLAAHYSGTAANNAASSGTAAASAGTDAASATLKSPKTGDTAPVALILTLLCLSGLGALVLTRRALRRAA